MDSRANDRETQGAFSLCGKNSGENWPFFVFDKISLVGLKFLKPLISPYLIIDLL